MIATIKRYSGIGIPQIAPRPHATADRMRYPSITIRSSNRFTQPPRPGYIRPVTFPTTLGLSWIFFADQFAATNSVPLKRSVQAPPDGLAEKLQSFQIGFTTVVAAIVIFVLALAYVGRRSVRLRDGDDSR